jgi:ribosome biogenesis ATPase
MAKNNNNNKKKRHNTNKGGIASNNPKTPQDLIDSTTNDEFKTLTAHIHKIQDDIFIPNSGLLEEGSLGPLITKLRADFPVYKTKYPVWTHMKPIVEEAIRVGRQKVSAGKPAFPSHTFDGMITNTSNTSNNNSDDNDNEKESIEIQRIKVENAKLQRAIDTMKAEEDKKKQNVVNSGLQQLYKKQIASVLPQNVTDASAVTNAEQRGVKRTKEDGDVNEEIADQVKKRARTRKDGAKKKGYSVEERPTTRYSDLGGIENVLQDIRELIEYPFTHPEIYSHLGVEPPRGVLLYGPPGSGKTMLATAIAGELGVPFFKISAPEVVSGMSGESEAKIRSLFNEAVKLAPSLIFIDEIDAITQKRETASREMEKRIVAQLLTCLDDCSFDKTDGKMVLVIGATNRPDSLDPALRRAGRFDREISLGIPDEAARVRILQVLSTALKLSGDFDFQSIAHMTPGFVGADLKALTKEAAVLAINRIFHTIFKDDQMDLDQESSESDQTTHNHTLENRNRVSELLKAQREPLSDEQLESLSITMNDFEHAVKKVQPSSKREGFATIPNVTWEDIGALEGIRDELRMAIMEPIKSPEKFTKLGMTAPCGVLLYGPPGCGKTMLAKAVSNDSGANFISIKGPELLNKFVGESERAIRQVFARASASSPCVIFFDELDALCPKRGYDASNASSERVVNQLLTEMDGLEERKSVFVIAATNRPDIIDPAMLRPGRLDKMLYVALPTPDERVSVLKTVSRHTPFTGDVNIEEIARSNRCDGFSGADLAQLVREASVCCLKEHLDLERRSNQPLSEDTLVVSRRHIEQAVDKVIPSVSPKDRRMYDNINKRLTTLRIRDSTKDNNNNDNESEKQRPDGNNLLL